MSLGIFSTPVRSWFEETFSAPTEAQARGWPAIAAGHHTLIAAPTGSGKTLAAFLYALDTLLLEGPVLTDATRVLYVSPLRALSNDVQRNLNAPLAALRARDAGLPEVRVLVRTGDTSPRDRAAMGKRPPHILVTTPESLYLLLTSESGRRVLGTVRVAIIDEIHALLGDKRGSHLALSLERLEALAGPVQRIGLSATQRPLATVARFLAGEGRECIEIDAGHLRRLDLAVEVPAAPLGSVCSHEQWVAIHERIVTLVRDHRTTLIFVNNRRQAERLAARLAERLEPARVSCHHSSLSQERRLAAERALKAGELSALVATASLELGIDIGEVDLVVQVGANLSIATLLQRVGRSGHGVDRVPRGRFFPLTRDELAEAAAALEAVAVGELDRTPESPAALDILAQHAVAECAAREWPERALYHCFRRAWPYRALDEGSFADSIAIHTRGRYALLHRDAVGERILGTRRARITALTSGGAIPDRADYEVLTEPDGTRVGSLNEDFAIESSAGDIFQLGNTSWRILRVQPGVVRVADAHGAPPTIPFWLGEAPGRSAELSEAISRQRDRFALGDGAPENGNGTLPFGLAPEVASLLAEYLDESRRVLGTLPSRARVVAERFFDESGGMQLVIHSLFGSRINRAWGLALRKRFCRRFGFELQAAANEEAILISLGPQHSFPLAEVFGYLHSSSVRDVLVQALLATPMFETRWRWNVTRALLVERMRGGKKVPAPLLRFRANDLLVAAFPQVLACFETLPPGDLPVPMEHPLVRQTVDDCLGEAMDIEGLERLLAAQERGEIERIAVDVARPSPLAEGILAAHPYSFLDDAPLEERRTQAVLTRRALTSAAADGVGALDPEAIRRVREEAWPAPRSAEEVHEALLWMGYATEGEAAPWGEWLAELHAAGRVERSDGRWYAREGPRDATEVMRGRLEALGPMPSDDPVLAALEAEGAVLRVRIDGVEQWCNRRLLARITRYTLEGLRREIEPVTTRDLLRFYAVWQHATEESRCEGPRGVAEVLRQLRGFELPAAAWEREVLPLRVRAYLPEWLDDLCLTGEYAWGRLWGSGQAAIRSTPVGFYPRAEFGEWMRLAEPLGENGVRGATGEIRDLLARRGAMFGDALEREARLVAAQVEEGLAELVALGWVTCDSFGGLRRLIRRRARRVLPARAGRWDIFRGAAEERSDPAAAGAPTKADSGAVARIAAALLGRYGVVFRKLLHRERIPIAWRDLLRHLRQLEVRGEVRGGRFVSAFDGEQFALPEAIPILRLVRRRDEWTPIAISAADPLNMTGILLPGERVPPHSRERLTID